MWSLSSSSSSSFTQEEAKAGFKRQAPEARKPPTSKIKIEENVGPIPSTSGTATRAHPPPRKARARKSTGAFDKQSLADNLAILERKLEIAYAERDSARSSMRWALTRLKAVLELVALLESAETYSLIKQMVRSVMTEFEELGF